MRIRWTFPLAVVVAGLFLATWSLETPASAHDPSASVSAIGAAVVAGDAKYTYVGSAACKKCHLKEHKSWAETKMGKAFQTLKPGNAKEVKEKFKLDANADYTKDTKCLKCHTVGFGEAGGYAVPAAGDEKAAKEMAKLEGVGCESCHGPGSEYIKVFEEITKSKRKYKLAELTAVGLKVPDEASCKSCHNGEGPTADKAKPFDYAKEKAKDKEIHEHVPLKDREG